MQNQLRPNQTEIQFLTLAYNRFYDIFAEVMDDSFWDKDAWYRFSKVKDGFGVYSELLNYEPLRWVLDNMKISRPPMEAEIARELFKFVRNITTHLPFFDSWEDVWMAIITFLDTGLRVSELAGITLGQVNFETGYVRVMGKGAKERIVPIGRFVQRTLLRYCEDVRPILGNSNCDALFLSRMGEPITTNAIKLAFSRLAKSSGIARLHAHLCRHTFAINYLLNGGNIFSLQEILGHTTLDMVRHYLHFTSSQITSQQHKYSPMDKLYIREKGSKFEKAMPLAVSNDIALFTNPGTMRSEYLRRN